jgi:ubiquitin-protein ligase
MSNATNLTAEQSLTARRLVGEVRQLEKNRETYYQVVQDTKDIFLFYFCLRNDDKKSPYYGGYYIGKIVLPNDYPKNPGDFFMLTPSGRFNVNAKICLTNSGYHKENWTAMWNISNMVVGFISIFTSDDTTGISHIKETPTERKTKATASINYNMNHHKDITLKFTQFFKPDGSTRSDTEIKEWIAENGPKRPVKKPNTKENTLRVKKNIADNKQAIQSTSNQQVVSSPKKNMDNNVNVNAVPNGINVGTPIKNNTDVASTDKSSPCKLSVNNQQTDHKKNNESEGDDVENLKSEDDVVPIKGKRQNQNQQKKALKEPIKNVSIKANILDDVSDSEEEIIIIGKKSNNSISKSKKVIKEPINTSKNKSNPDTKKITDNSSKTMSNINSKKANYSPKADTQRVETIKVVGKMNKNKQYPTDFKTWRKMIDVSTLETHDPKLFRMVF